jgi:hypothetical protein
MLDILVPEKILNDAEVNPVIHQAVATPVAQHVGMDREVESCHAAGPG